MLSVLQTLDGGALLWIQENLRGLLDPIVEGYTTLGNTGLMWIVLSLAMLCWKPTRKAGVAALAAMVLGLVLCCLRHLLVSHRLHRRQRGDPAGRPDPVCVPLCSA